MHELYNLEKGALEGYSNYNFPKGTSLRIPDSNLLDECCGAVVNALTHFANVTLSSLYFDITKDCLYADSRSDPKRRAIEVVLEQV
jgi:isoleucyl-tRNA synthetase